MRNINDRREAAATRIQRLQRHRVQQRRQHELQTQAHPLNQEVEEEEGPAVPSETEPTSPLDANEGSVEENEADNNMRRSIETLRTSISDMRDELIQGSSHRSEPMVRLRRSAQGSESNLVSVEHGQLATSETSNDFFNNGPIQAEEPRARPSVPDITIEDGEEQSEAGLPINSMFPLSFFLLDSTSIYCAKSLMKPKKNWDSIMVSLCLVQGHCQGQLFCYEKANRKNVC